MTEKAYDIGKEIKRLRLERKLSTRKLAQVSELSQPYISQIENGHAWPSAETLIALAPALDVSCIYLFIKAGWVTEVQVTAYARQMMRS